MSSGPFLDAGISTDPPKVWFNADTGPLKLALPKLGDKCMARVVKVFVDRTNGNIWRVIDPMSPTEKLPVVKEWTEATEIKWTDPDRLIPEKHVEQVPGTQPTAPTIRIIPYLITVDDNIAHFDFDIDQATVPDSEKQRVADALREFPQSDVLIFAHADRCHMDGFVAGTAPGGLCIPKERNNRSYNMNLSQRRAISTERVMVTQNTSISTAPPTVTKFGCSNFCNLELTDDERNNRGKTSPNKQTPEGGSATNRRSDLFVIPHWDKFTEYLNNDPQIQSLKTEVNSRGGSWSGDFPCPGCPNSLSKANAPVAQLKNCTILSTDANGGGAPTPHLENGQPHCRFYKRIKEYNEQGVTVQIEPGTPGTPPSTREVTTYRREKGAEHTRTVISGRYHAPDGEHYSFNLENLIDLGIQCGPVLPPNVAVAPNDKANPKDFNLIKAGPLRFVKMDVGFWGDQRKSDLDRKSGFRRDPQRHFGVIEGPWVYLCYFETKETQGFAKACDDQVDDKLNPLFARFIKAVKDAGHKVLIMKKAVADAGPPKGKLWLFLGDMHLPRKFDEKDPKYSNDECIYRYQMIRAMIVKWLERDYRLRAVQTPWLSVHDRRLCRDFFEHGAPTLKLPQYSTGRAGLLSNPFEPEGDTPLAQAADAAKKAFQAIQQIGYYLFEFTQNDRRREVKRYADNIPEKGRGRIKDAFNNWFYGFETDRNVFGPGGPKPQSPVGSALDDAGLGVVTDVADAWGANLGRDQGSKPAQERYDRIEGGPARDLLRLLKVVEKEKSYVQLFHTGDLFELYGDRRFLFEDFPETDDPPGQEPSLIHGIEKVGQSSFLGPVAGPLSDGLRIVLRTLLAGINPDDHDVWYRRECKRNPPNQPLPDEMDITVKKPGDWTGPRFHKSPGGGVGVDTSGTQPYDRSDLTGLNEDGERGRGYLTNEAATRLAQVRAFEAPVRTDNAGKKEDIALLGGSYNKSKDLGRWNEAVERALSRATKVYGNHDNLDNIFAPSRAKGFHCATEVWVEHGHRYDDSNNDGQTFDSFMTNLGYDITEPPLYEGLLDEFLMHREQSYYQPGMAQWFLMMEFGLDQLDPLRTAKKQGSSIDRFCIAVNGHTHTPDLCIEEIIFRAKEVSNLELLITDLGAAVKAILMVKKIYEWFEKWNDRNGWQKWWEDIKGNTIDWGVDFGGLGKCLDKAKQYLEQGWEDTKKKFRDEADATRQSFEDLFD